MDKFRTDLLGGLPFVLDDIRQFLGRLTSPANHGIYQAFNNLIRGFGDNFIVQGIVASGTSPNVAITEGWVILDGELVKVDAQTGINTTTDNKFVKVTTFDPRGNKDFLNGSTADTYEKNRAVIQGTSGNLDFDANTFSDLRTITDVSGVDTPLKTKTIPIGDWDMDTTSTVSVAHGLSDIFKIRSITAMIINDDTTTIDRLDKFTTLNNQSEGGIGSVNATSVALVRRLGGIFDAVFYDSLSFNRGFITIEFEA